MWLGPRTCIDSGRRPGLSLLANSSWEGQRQHRHAAGPVAFTPCVISGPEAGFSGPSHPFWGPACGKGNLYFTPSHFSKRASIEQAPCSPGVPLLPDFMFLEPCTPPLPTHGGFMCLSDASRSKTEGEGGNSRAGGRCDWRLTQRV